MNIEDQEKLLDKLNKEIIKIDRRIKRIPFDWLRNWAYKKQFKRIAIKNEVWRNLRDATREKYPERFSTDNYIPEDFNK